MKLRPRNRAITVLLSVAILATLLAAPAAADEPAELAEARAAYRLTLQQASELEQQQRLAELRRVNGPYDNTGSEFAWIVERWRPVVDLYFPADMVDWALRIIDCESGGDPVAKNPNSTASGLFQHLASLWSDRASAAEWEDADVFDPFANIAVAAWLLDNGGTGHWVCKG
ncbi:MAG: transglycosylase SLT domain-containing protein [Actinomycetota bacterium]|nr:transglycosylase SLT domain-containing protein [Actinomycetota bacterium]